MATQPWPWYIAGPLIGLLIPALLVLGNKSFGISANLRHFCAMCIPANIPFFKYDWKREIWNFFFIGGIVGGAFIGTYLLSSGTASEIHPDLSKNLASYSIQASQGLYPEELFNWEMLGTAPGFIVLVVGGFLIGFGTRYAGGCTSGHAIMGLSTLQWPSLLATIAFMAGGFIMTHLILPHILSLLN